MQRIDRMLLVAAIVAICGVAFTALLYVLNPAPFFPSYLVAFLYWMDLTLGCLAFLMLTQLVQGGWGVATERILAAGARTVALMALLFLPLLFGLGRLYLWSTSAEFQAAHAHQSLPYLSTPFFIIRAVVAFLIWFGLAYGVSQWSYQRDQSRTQRWGYGLARLAAFGMVLYVITASYTAFDWSMSLDPFWFSSIYGWLAIARQGLVAMALTIVVLALIWRNAPLLHLVTQRVIDDLATILLATVMLWTYMSFFQFLIIWYGNLPHEIRWFAPRIAEGWGGVAAFLVVFHFAIPFVMLIVPAGQRSLSWIASAAGLLLIMHLVEIHWLVMPTFSPSPAFNWLDLALPVTMGALWCLVFFWSLRSYPLASVSRSQLLQATTQHKQEPSRLTA